MDLIKKFREKASSDPKRIVLPETDDERVLQAARIIIKEKIAKLVFLGKPETIEKQAKKHHLDINNVEIIDHLRSERFGEFAADFYKQRKHSGITEEEAKKNLSHPVYFAAMLLKNGLADGYVAGAANTSRLVARSAIYCVGPDKSIGTVSSSFIMIIPDCQLGYEGLFLFADCGVVPNPSAKQLCNIAISTAELTKSVCGIEPLVAMLSYSTKSSGAGDMVDKIRHATKLVKEKKPDLKIEGELQVDAAIVPEVARIKAPDTKLGGRANVLIFPDLESGNISYKLVQRLARARAVGPLLQGLNKPCSDLSRGCSVDDVVDAVAVTAIRAQQTASQEKNK